jgi:PhnB protein
MWLKDVDAAYKRALECGATSLAEPEDKPYDERVAGVKDTFGNTWWISTFKKRV